MTLFDWITDPKIQQNIAPQKLILLTQLSTQANAKSKEELIPFFLTAASKANSLGISFTPQETDIILNVIMSHLAPAEQTKMETIKTLARLLSERNTQKQTPPKKE